MSLYPIDLKDWLGIPWDGEVFGVDPGNGSDSYTGKKRNQCFATMQAAIDACTDNQGDLIIRFPGSETVTSSITVDCAGITIISTNALAALRGIGSGGNPREPEKFSTYPSTSMTGPTFLVSQPCTIMGIEVVGRNTTSAYIDAATTSGAALALAGHGGGYSGGFCHIKWCRFVDWWGNDYGIEMAAGAYNLIEECTFEGYGAGVYIRGTSTNNPAYNVIQRCKFIDCTNGIEHRTGYTPGNFVYQENVFVDYTDAIDFNNTAANGSVLGNYYDTATDAATYDVTVGTAQAFGVQFAGNNYSE